MSKPQKSGSILIVDDHYDILVAAKLFLKRYFAHIETSTDPERIPSILAQHTFDVVVLDMNFTKDISSGKEGFDWLQRIKNLDATLPVVMMTAYGDIQLAIKAMKMGATDFVLKPWDNEAFLKTLRDAIQKEKNELSETTTNNYQQKFPTIIGESEPMLAVFNVVDKIAATDANVLVLGENGTGKELIAKAIHEHSNRSSGPFVSVDLGSISASLFESELFGHKKGAFTDAREDRVGRFELAQGGTLFLDEIGNLSPHLQSKLLTALQSRKIVRVGSTKEIPIDIRLICATNMSLPDMISKKEFRQDLLYRINTIEIDLPPLRERKGDIVLLADHYLKQYSEKYQKKLEGFHKNAYLELKAYNWPGNIRELQHTIERAVIMSTMPMLSTDDFQLKRQASDAETLDDSWDTSTLHEIEKQHIKKVMTTHDGNISLAAEQLGITRASLYRRLKKYGL
ncbi:sigma-54-dependent Fis family transcriptional regulator [Kordia sp. YSTF-M3]|uniref:Sigma-54-dependent Fis family transcriptional regulator n=1 Tax=Kordia aestuariivivens TaxID=2759037 RepID=A0ABR7QFK8_9FLAO|nr:sigma-54 dependent transcriptional regulator [Kordia aestuariivivens]MBC8757084.1 sigma-54-dependent Fis family transcriptional regulator [Kordia aestuariivivens]